jgi:DNA-binding transcriptional MerR regulator
MGIRIGESAPSRCRSFPSDRSILTTKEMAQAIGISQSYLRYLERKGKVPSPPRDTNGKRMWKKKDVGKVKRKLEKLRSK